MQYTYLAHHGVKGQKWGRRRYQNPDGSLTAEGYQHWGLNPDGSRFRARGRNGYSHATTSASQKGGAIGLAAGVAAGAALGPVAAMGAGTIGSLSGAMLGTAVGAIKTSHNRKYIKKMISENKKVYVKDLW